MHHLDQLAKYNERWKRRQFSRFMAVAVGILGALFFLLTE